MINILNLIKRINCVHNYELYYVDRVPQSLNSLQYEYKYICSKCGKIFSITETKIIEIIEECEEEFNKDVCLNKININDYKTIQFTIKPCWSSMTYGYTGKYLNWVIEELNKKGIKLLKNQFGQYFLDGTKI